MLCGLRLGTGDPATFSLCFLAADDSPAAASVPGAKTYRCPRCPKSYRQSASLWNHRKFECGQQQQFHCPLCQFCCKRPSNLNRHSLKMHSALSRARK
jgi:uncharacterized Zn-finger protein